MARSVDDIVPESTDIPGGGVVETDDGSFWVPGPPPVGFTEEGKASWERGVELLRERPELFKTQVIADDGLPVPSPRAFTVINRSNNLVCYKVSKNLGFNIVVAVLLNFFFFRQILSHSRIA